LPVKSLKTICVKARHNRLFTSQKKAGLTKGRGIHSLRHTFATHSLYQGTDLYTLKRFLGHASLKSTIIYLHLLPERLQQCKSPLDTLYEDDE
jgi:site-specific recombinase XerD